jgi:VWFA-related protein
MFRLIAVLLLVGLAGPAFAAKQMTIAQFEQMLASQHGGSDAAMADRLSEVELTERASTPQLLRWEAQFPGSRTRMVLIGLADSSAFLDPPADELPTTPRPDIKTQEQMVRRAIGYLNTTVTKLPNFFASRDTVHFEDTPAAPGNTFSAPPDISGRGATYFNMAPGSEPLHMISRYSVIVRYRDGAEVQDAKGKSHSADATAGLTTRGEFGPILTMVLSDALHSKTVWQRWENGSHGPVAVFHYSVPRENSHYTVVLPKEHKMAAMMPAYHGEIAIDPIHGDILRLTLITDLDPAYKLVDTDLLVEYGSVTIGEQTYTCPLRSIAYSRMPEYGDPDMWATADYPIVTRINDVAFTQYHLFHSDSRIVDAAQIDPANRVQPEEDTTTTEAAAPTAAAPAVATTPPAAATTAASEASAPPAVAAVPAEPPMTPAGTTNVLHAHARLVLVDVVVSDHGSAVHGLKRSQMHIFEDGKEQKISSFEEHTPKPAALRMLPPLPPATFTNVPAFRPTGTLNILLLDGLNTPPQNMKDTVQQVQEYVSHSAQGNAIAVFALGGQLRLIQGFSTDISSIAQAVKAADAASRTSLPRNTGGSNPASDTDSEMGAMLAMAPTPQARLSIAHTMQQTEQHEQDVQAEDTSERVRATLEALQQLAHYLSAVPGRKNLIWISGSFPAALIADASETVGYQPDLQRNNHDFMELIRQTSEALAAARIAVYPIDARGLMTMPSANVDVERTHSVSVDASGNLRSTPGDVHDDANFRSTTQLEHGSMQQIADQTGGRAFVDTNGLKEAVARAMDDGASYYTIGYVPPNDADSRFRTVRVKMDASHATLSYRSGYYLSAPAESVSDTSGAKASTPMAAAVALGVPTSSQILLRARVLPASDSLVHSVPDASESTGALTTAIKGPLRRYVVDLMLDPATITLTSDPGGTHHAQFDCAVVAYDATSHRVQALDRRVRLNMTAAEYDRVLTYGLPYQVAIDLPQRPVTLRVAVYDPVTGHTGSIEAQIAATDR